jgi:HD-GYP domain-containing protein (c-di-GMP phosphodiesterase class II)
LSIPLIDMVLCLSQAVDLVSGVVADHHKRVALAAASFARGLGLPPDDRLDVLAAAAVHDIGALSLAERIAALDFEMHRPHEHGATGWLLLRDFAPFAKASELVRFHHVPWDRGRGLEFQGRPVPLGSHVLHLADRVDVLAAGQEDILAAAPDIVRRVRAEAPDRFMPDLVEVFCEEAVKESFWLDLASPSIDRCLAEAGRAMEVRLGPAELLELATLFGRVVDFRSRFTAVHSSCVAACGGALAGFCGFPEDRRILLHVAGSLHDLGKLAVPAEILNSAKPLSTAQWNVIRRHAYHTRAVLERIEGLSEAADWASQHHERLDGKGYPFHLAGRELSLGSRIVAVADVFSAVKEDRSYRRGMPDEAALRTLEREAARGLLDGEVVAVLRERHPDVDDALRGARQRALGKFEAFSQDLAGNDGAGTAPEQGENHGQ